MIENTTCGEPKFDLQRERFRLAFNWVAAIDAHDFADPEPLDRLLRGQEPIPAELRGIIANVSLGKRKAKRGATNSKIEARDRMQIAALLSAYLGVIDIVTRKKTEFNTEDGLKTNWPIFEDRVAKIADERGLEPVAVRHEMQATGRKVIAIAAVRLNVSEETVENLMRDFRKKLKNYPKI